jgi:formyl-CoA transferase
MARQLIAEADVLVENFRPGTLEGWGMSPEELHHQPRPGDPAHLGLRPDRPLPRPAGLWRDRRGHGRPAPPDGRAGRVPVRVGVSIGDTLAALHGVIGVMMALYHRKVNGGRAR